MPPPVYRFITDLLERVPASERAGITLRTGACVGVDEVVAERGHHLGYHVHTVVPWNRSLVARDWARWAVTFEEMEPGSSYRDRNMRLLEGATFLTAFPARPEKDPSSRRSGTWMTVRLAVARHITVSTYVISDICAGRY